MAMSLMDYLAPEWSARKQLESQQALLAPQIQQFQGLLGQAPQVSQFQPDTFPGENPAMLSGQNTQNMATVNQGSGLLGGQISPQEFYGRLMTIPNYEKAGQAGLLGSMGGESNLPAAVQTYQYWKNLPTQKEKDDMLRTMRQQSYLNMGGYYGAPSPSNPANMQNIGNKTLPPEALPQTKFNQAKAGVEGTGAGTASSTYQDLVAAYPGSIQMADKLHNLGKLSTYTAAGQVFNTAARQLGFDLPDAASARAMYISTIDNEIIPNLKKYLGGQFTQQEGDQLRATLGDKNKSPAEKDAYLQAFIEGKVRKIQAEGKRAGFKVPDLYIPKYSNIGDTPTDSSGWSIKKIQ